MGLETDAVDCYAALFERFDKVLRRGGFGAGVFDVVVVVVEFDCGVVFASGFKCDCEVFGADLEGREELVRRGGGIKSRSERRGKRTVL